MKKFLVFFMTLVLTIVCLSAMSMLFSAHNLAFVEETYCYADVVSTEFGKHAVAEDGALTEVPLFGDGRWTFEWFDCTTKTFYPMGAYFTKRQDGWVHSGWDNFYTATVESAWVKSGNTYCSIRPDGERLSSGALYTHDGARMHPGDTAGAVITFIVPVSGNISFEGSVYPYGTHTSDSENGGDALYLYLNDTLVYPTNLEDAIFYSDTASKENPAKVELNAFDVKEGDRVRFVLTTKPGTTNGSKGCNLVDAPTVTYHSTADGTPVGNPKGYPPENITYQTTGEACHVSWDAVEGAVGYNVFIGGVKVNKELVGGNKYVVEGLRPQSVYYLSVSAVKDGGLESDPSAEHTFKTKTICVEVPPPILNSPESPFDSDSVIDNSTTGTTTDNVDDATTNAGNVTTTTTAPAESGSSILWIIIAAAVAAVVAIVVVVIVLSKKKKAE